MTIHSAEVDRIAPGIADRMFLMRPVMATPPLCGFVDLRTTLTLDDVADLHEILDLKDELARRQAEAANKKR